MEHNDSLRQKLYFINSGQGIQEARELNDGDVIEVSFGDAICFSGSNRVLYLIPKEPEQPEPEPWQKPSTRRRLESNPSTRSQLQSRKTTDLPSQQRQGSTTQESKETKPTPVIRGRYRVLTPLRILVATVAVVAMVTTASFVWSTTQRKLKSTEEELAQLNQQIPTSQVTVEAAPTSEMTPEEIIERRRALEERKSRHEEILEETGKIMGRRGEVEPKTRQAPEQQQEVEPSRITVADNNSKITPIDGQYVTKAMLVDMGWSADYATDSVLKSLNDVLEDKNINTINRISHFCGQIMMETGIDEQGYPTPIEIDNDSKYAGAGGLQLTGKNNYKFFSERAGDPKIYDEGATYVAEKYFFESAGDFWDWPDVRMNERIDGGADVETVTFWINRSEDLNDPAVHLDRRKAATAKVMEVLESQYLDLQKTKIYSPNR